MKNILLSALLAVGLVVTTIDRASAEAATPDSQTTAKFYCGTAKDPSSNDRELPATLFTNAEVPEPRAIIIWKSEYFGSKFDAQKRCEIVSPKFQTAIEEGRTNITSALDKQSGQGIICALANQNEVCDRSKMLYTLKSNRDAQVTIDRLESILKTNNVAVPRYESARGAVVDLRNLLHRK
jgi:Circadian oscillating protein COP23